MTTAGAAFTPYQRKLFFFLGIASFFEGYDFIALTQILPNLRHDFSLPPQASGYLVTAINVGTVLAYLMVRQADAWGRRRVLTWTIVGYTTATFLTGLAPNVWAFALCQLVARIFLIGEWAVSLVIAAEEFPAARRGMVLGVISAMGSFGSVACAGLVPLLLKTSFGWRTVYFTGVVPLIVLAFMRRDLRETQRFVDQVAGQPQRLGLWRIWRTPYRRRTLQLGLIWLLTYVCTQNGVAFWKEFALAERGWSDHQVGLAVTIAAISAMPFVFLAGKLLDVVGRRYGAIIIFVLSAAGIYGAYTLQGRWPLTAALALGVFGASAVLPVLNAYGTELFPTELRSDAFAWTNNLIGRIGYVVSPAIVGYYAADHGWGRAVSATAFTPLLALLLILWWMPETRAKELEETATA